MVPRHHPLDVDHDAEPLGPGPVEEGLHLLRPLADVPLEDAAADLHERLAVLDDLGPADQLDALQVLVHVAGLDQAGDLRVALEVEDLLRASVGPERRAPVEEAVPHGHEVDAAVVVDGADVHRVPALEELLHLAVVHADEVTPFHAGSLTHRQVVFSTRTDHPTTALCGDFVTVTPQCGAGRSGRWSSSGGHGQPICTGSTTRSTPRTG